MRPRRAEPAGESKTRVHVTGVLAEKFAARVSRGKKRPHSGSRYRCVSHTERGRRVELATQTREVRVVAVALGDVETVVRQRGWSC